MVRNTMVEMSEVMEVIEFASESFANGRRGGVRGRSYPVSPFIVC